MSKKTIRLALVIGIATAGLFTSNVLQAQVTIGGDTPPKTGAILDLNSDLKGGLLFPNIEITDLGKIPGGYVLSGIHDEAEENEELTGMVVYNNTANEGIPVGLYVWDGTDWHKLANSDVLSQLQTTIEDVSTALPDKANIYVSLVQNIQVGSNLKGVHIQPKAPFNAETWSYRTAGNAKLEQTDNDLVYTDNANTPHPIVTAGVINEDNFIIPDEFVITQINDDPININLLYHWFDIQDIEKRIGSLSALNTSVKSNIVESINDLSELLVSFELSDELPLSPFDSYADFLEEYTQVGDESTRHKFAYVTFTDVDISSNIPDAWSGRVKVNETWRLDCSSNGFSPTTNMTNAITATLGAGSSSELPTTGQPHNVSDILQTYRNNLNYLIQYLGGHLANLANPHQVTKAQVGLGNVDNTSDASKPVSTATQTALNGKQNNLTATGADNLLLAPASQGGQPTAKPVADFVQIDGKETIIGTKFFTPSATLGLLSTNTDPAGSITAYRYNNNNLGFEMRHSATVVQQLVIYNNAHGDIALRKTTDNGATWGPWGYYLQASSATNNANTRTYTASADSKEILTNTPTTFTINLPTGYFTSVTNVQVTVTSGGNYGPKSVVVTSKSATQVKVVVWHDYPQSVTVGLDVFVTGN